MLSKLLRSAMLGCAVSAVCLPASASVGVRVATLDNMGWLAWQPTATAPSPGAGWNKVGFDTTGWIAPTILTGLEAISSPAHYVPPPSAVYVLPPSMGQQQADYMWLGSADGTGGPDHIFMRTAFSLPAWALFNAEVRLQVDDDFAFFVNGVEVLLNNDGGYADRVYRLNIGSYLHAGENVFAIEAVDGGWSNPRDRSYQDVLLDAVIWNGPIVSVPEPATLALAFLGLGGVAGWSRRRGGP